MTNDHTFNSSMNNYESTQEIVHRHIMAAAEKALAQLDETPDNESPSKKSLAERLASRREKNGILSEENIRLVLNDFFRMPVKIILEQPGEEIHIAVALDLFAENDRKDIDIDQVTIGDWMTEVEKLLDRQADAENRLSVYKRFTEGFIRNLKKVNHPGVLNFLQINYSVLAEMMNFVSDYITQEFFDRIVTDEYVIDDERRMILDRMYEDRLLKKLQNCCSNEKLTVGGFLGQGFPAGTYKPFGRSDDYFVRVQSTWSLQYLGFWRLVFKAVKEVYAHEG